MASAESVSASFDRHTVPSDFLTNFLKNTEGQGEAINVDWDEVTKKSTGKGIPALLVAFMLDCISFYSTVLTTTQSGKTTDNELADAVSNRYSETSAPGHYTYDLIAYVASSAYKTIYEKYRSAATVEITGKSSTVFKTFIRYKSGITTSTPTLGRLTSVAQVFMACIAHIPMKVGRMVLPGIVIRSVDQNTVTKWIGHAGLCSALKLTGTDEEKKIKLVRMLYVNATLSNAKCYRSIYDSFHGPSGKLRKAIEDNADQKDGHAFVENLVDFELMSAVQVHRIVYAQGDKVKEIREISIKEMAKIARYALDNGHEIKKNKMHSIAALMRTYGNDALNAQSMRDTHMNLLKNQNLIFASVNIDGVTDSTITV